MQSTGVLRSDVRPQAVRSALLGMLEGMMRDLFLAKSIGFPADYSAEDMPYLLSLTIGALLVPSEPASSPRAR
jgi:hypothetical protein